MTGRHWGSARISNHSHGREVGTVCIPGSGTTPVPAKLSAMLQNYPKRARNWESLAQIVLLVSVLAIAGFYSTIMERAHEPEVEERLAVMMQALKTGGVAFLLALCVRIETSAAQIDDEDRIGLRVISITARERVLVDRGERDGRHEPDGGSTRGHEKTVHGTLLREG